MPKKLLLDYTRVGPYHKDMPSKNTVKLYVEGGYYHLYNRGVEKRIIFLDHQDYSVFLRFLKEYLLVPNHPDLINLRNSNNKRHPINCSSDIDLLAFCLMPNHFHLFIKQKTVRGIQNFVRALLTNFVMYFNHKYERVGPLFQGRYKAALIENESQFLHLSRYIHINPKNILSTDQVLSEYSYSSYPYYLGKKKADWIKTQEILAMFRSPKSIFPKDILSYESFVEDYIADDNEILGEYMLE